MTTQLTPAPRPAALRAAAGEAPVFGGSSLLTQIRILTGRSLRAMVTDPGIVLFGLIQPVVILFVLTQVFSKMGMPPHFPEGVTYLDYVLPAILVDNAAQSAMQSGVGLVEDQKNGMVARLRSLPVHPGALLAARSLVGLVRATVQVLIIMVLAITVLGYSPNGGVAELALSAGLTVFISFSLGWAFIAAGAWLRRAEPLQNLALIVIFPLMFASSAYVPVADLPGWLAAVANVNPLTYAIDASRALALDVPGLDHAIPSVVISAVIAVVGMVAALRGFRRPL
ncbi:MULTISPECIES: ABC transporter permease [Streptomyces]|uniref:ABC transporter permease n=1 Tax=Streptomyces TaxID=1883 RepID=UPI00156E76B8|nr:MULTISPECIES: ABC transporter permease [unclassified Streptomyces]NSL43121.1 ABC transporter permease [Streptomyces sp. 8P21H-1]